MAANQPLIDLADPKGRRIDELLRTEIIAWFATVRPDGRPHLAPVWFLWEGDGILVFSKPGVKVNNLKHNARVSLGIGDAHGSNVLIEGEATLLNPGEITTAMPPYAEKYADYFNQYGWTGESMSKEYSQPIRIRVTKVF